MPLFQQTAAQQQASAILVFAANAFNTLVLNYKIGYDMLWNPDPSLGVTTANILAEWGTNATSVFEASAATRDYIEAQASGTLPTNYLTPQQAVTYNQDGTVTINS